MRPDALVGAAVVVCAKMTWGLDGEIRHAHPKQDGAATEVPKSRAWIRALEQQGLLPKTQNVSELIRYVFNPTIKGGRAATDSLAWG